VNATYRATAARIHQELAEIDLVATRIEQIALLVEHLPAVHHQVKAELEQFAGFLEQSI
jgi:hypothetical protein